MERDAGAHEIGLKDEVLEETVGDEEDYDPGPVRESGENGDQDDGGAGRERSDHGNEFEEAGERSQEDAVGHANGGEEGSIKGEGREAEDDDGPHELGEHPMEVGEDFLQNSAARTGFNVVSQEETAELGSVLEEEEADDGDEYEEGQVAHEFQNLAAGALEEREDIDDVLLDLLADGLSGPGGYGEFDGLLEVADELREARGESGGLLNDFGSEGDADGDQDGEQKKIDQGERDGAGAVAIDVAVDQIDHRGEQIGKQQSDGEDEERLADEEQGRKQERDEEDGPGCAGRPAVDGEHMRIW